MGTLGGFPTAPAMSSGERSSPALDAISMGTPRSGRMRGLHFVVAAALCALSGGCRTRAPVIQGLVLPIELVGPTCGADGPSVAILGARPFRCGKGDTCTSLDVRVQNHAKRPLWFLLDGDRDFSGTLDSVDIQRSSVAPSPPVWAFYGDNVNRAVLVPPGADLVLRSLPFFPAIERFRAAFFDRLILEYTQHVDWPGEATKGTMPLRGDFDLGWIDRSWISSTPAFQLEGRQRVSLDTWCTVELPVSP